jgi:CHAT domain-containing protein
MDAVNAWELKACFDALESSEPERAIAIAGSLQQMADAGGNQECMAIAAWTRGMADQLEGDLGASLVHLEEAELLFAELDQPLHAASTLISKLFSLAMLSRYDEALRTGLRARAVFLREGDLLAAGKIEQNLGNIYFRRDEYRKAEQLYRTARKRFVQADDPKQLAQIDNCLASALTWQHKFDAALDYYQQALTRATEAGLQVTEAEIESNLGGHMLFQARYDRALDYLERARRRYAGLGLELEAALSEKELAEAYLELNLIPEALALLQRLLPVFEEHGMQADLAGAFVSYGRACVQRARLDDAAAALATARTLYAQEENLLGLAHVELVEIERLLAAGEVGSVPAQALAAEAAAAQGQAWELWLRLRTLRAEANLQIGATDAGRELYAATLTQAQARGYPQIELRCCVALGTLALAQGELQEASRLLHAGLASFELLRATLPNEEFRLSFRGAQTELFHGLIALALRARRPEEAFQLVERSRSHTLLELVSGTIPSALEPQDEYEAAMLQTLARQRSELNWFYHQLRGLPDGGDTPGPQTLAEFHRATQAREREIAELVRQLQMHQHPTPTPSFAPLSTTSPMPDVNGAVLPLVELQAQLGDATALIEYYGWHDRLLAFVVTGSELQVMSLPLPADAIEQMVRQLRFQIDTLRHGSEHLQRQLPRLAERANHYLRELHAALVAPLASLCMGKRLVVVPHGALHYVPFHALHDGQHHLIETTEVCVTPSAGVLLHCLQGARRRPEKVALFGAPDASTPMLAHEIATLAALMPAAQVRIGEAATVAEVRALAPSVDLLHLACHGHFRPDNPMFSALQLADGRLTARDAYDLRLHCALVTLSACETGINAVTPGDELLGLVRGFLAGGAPALLVSLWPVDDAVTVRFMERFYAAWLGGEELGQAHRTAQRALLAEFPHPFFWSPFVLYGRWY